MDGGGERKRSREVLDRYYMETESQQTMTKWRVMFLLFSVGSHTLRYRERPTLSSHGSCEWPSRTRLKLPAARALHSLCIAVAPLHHCGFPDLTECFGSDYRSSLGIDMYSCVDAFLLLMLLEILASQPASFYNHCFTSLYTQLRNLVIHVEDFCRWIDSSVMPLKR